MIYWKNPRKKVQDQEIPEQKKNRKKWEELYGRVPVQISWGIQQKIPEKTCEFSKGHSWRIQKKLKKK